MTTDPSVRPITWGNAVAIGHFSYTAGLAAGAGTMYLICRFGTDLALLLFLLAACGGGVIDQIIRRRWRRTS